MAIHQALGLMSQLAPKEALVESKVEVEPAMEMSSEGDLAAAVAPSFVQTGETQRRSGHMLGAKELAALASMASRGGGNGFDSVRKVIQNMVDILNKDQAEEEKLTKTCRQ